jgi:DNA-binding NarL/FixJ family response regulator
MVKSFGSNLTDPSRPISILMLSAADRRRDAILAILRTLPGPPEILCADNLKDARHLLDFTRVGLVILDHSLETDAQKRALEEIRRTAKPVWIIQLVAHPREAFSLGEPRPDTVLCDGFSSADLLDEIQKTKPKGLRTHIEAPDQLMFKGLK